MHDSPTQQEAAAVPIDLDRSLANFDVEDVGSCAKSWARVRVAGSPPRGRASHSATALDCFRFVVIGGGACDSEGRWTHFADAHTFDVRTRAWCELAAAPDPSAGPFPARRGHAAALWQGEKVLVFGGTTGGTGDDGFRNDCWALDVSSQAWRRLEPTGPVPPARRGALGFLAAGRFLVAGGYVSRRMGGLDPRIHVLEPEEQVWSCAVIHGQLPPPFALAAGAAVGHGCIYILGGSPGVGLLRLRVRPEVPDAPRGSAAVSAGGAGGPVPADRPQGSRKSVCIEVTECGMKGELPSPRFCHGMAAIADRWLLVFGGTSAPVLDSEGNEAPQTTLNDCYLLDLRRCGGSKPLALGRQVLPTGPGAAVPQERNGFTMVGAGTKFLVFGGGVFLQAYYDDTWALDLHLRPDVAIPTAAQGADLGADFAWLRESSEGLALADVTLAVGDEGARRSFPAHRAVLCARSDYFRALLAGGFREAAGDCCQVALPDVDAASFELALAYLYTGRLHVMEPAAMDDSDAACPPEDLELLAAARTGEPAEVARALAAGADADARDSDTGGTALHLAAACGPAEESSAEVVALLAAARADLNATTPSGETAVQLAARHGRKAVARALLGALRGIGHGAAAPAGDAAAAGLQQGAMECDDAGQDDGSLAEVLGVAVCADRLGLSHLSLLCEQWLARALRPGNACELLEVADSLGCAQLKLVCLHFLKRHGRCRRSQAFAALPQALQEEVAVAVQGL